MRYKVTIHFRDGRVENYETDGYTSEGGVFQLYTHTPTPSSKIKIFPLVDIKEILMVDKSA